MEYKHVGNHPEDLASGRMLGPGETVDSDAEDLTLSHNARLLEEGILIPVDRGDQEKSSGADKKQGGKEG